MINKAIEIINEQIKAYTKYGFEWSIANQLIDILSVQPQSLEIVLQDLSNEDMSIKSLVSHIAKKRTGNPYVILEDICKFYGIETPSELPPEMWRSTIASKPQAPTTPKFLIVDYMV